MAAPAESAHVQADYVAMTPDRTVRWGRYEIPRLAGSLFLRPDAPAEWGDLIVAAAENGPAFQENKPCIQGYFATISHEEGNLALKLFKPRRRDFRPFDSTEGLSALRANVILETGIARHQAKQTDIPAGVTYTTPSMYGAFVPARRWGRRQRAYPVQLMSYESGVPATQVKPELLPAYVERKIVYDAAVSLCGALPADFDYDDTGGAAQFPKNILVRNPAHDAASELVKFDVMAANPIDV